MTFKTILPVNDKKYVWCRMHIEDPWTLAPVAGNDFSYHYTVPYELEGENNVPPPKDYIPKINKDE